MAHWSFLRPQPYNTKSRHGPRFLNVARWGGDRLRTVTLTLNPRHDSTTPSPTCSSHVTQSLPIHTTCAHPDGGVCTPRWGGLERQESRLSLPLFFLVAKPYVTLYFVVHGIHTREWWLHHFSRCPSYDFVRCTCCFSKENPRNSVNYRKTGLRPPRGKRG